MADRRALVIWWDPETNVVELDAQGLSVFDTVGLLEVALGIAEDDLPSCYVSEEADGE